MECPKKRNDGRLSSTLPSIIDEETAASEVKLVEMLQSGPHIEQKDDEN